MNRLSCVAVCLMLSCSSAPATCGQGLVVDSSGGCSPTLSCGAGTQQSGTECIPVSSAMVSCGSGTVLQGTVCVTAAAQVSCGSGTALSGTSCVGTLSCGTGTTQSGNACTSLLNCGTGTTQSGNTCTSSLSCGAGTTNVAGACRANLGVICGTDTAPANGNTTCVSTVTCGTNTMRVGNTCVSQGSACGSGTLLQNGSCVIPTPVTGLTSFVRQTGLRSASASQPSMVVMGFTTPSSRYMLLTDFAQVLADAYVRSGTAPVGTGTALHLSMNEATIGLPLTVSVVNDVQADGGCSAVDARARPTNGGSVRLSYGTWANSTLSKLACGQGGIVEIERVGSTLELTFNAQLSDGTLFQNEVITLPY